MTARSRGFCSPLVRAASLLAMLLLVPVLGCGPSRTPEAARADLTSPDLVLRLKAARDIEAASHNGPLPADVLDQLLAQAPRESDAKTKGAMHITLGFTGDPRAKPLLDAYVQTEDRDQQRWAGRALRKWMVLTGQLPATYKFPDNWPYGTAGYPPPAPKK